MIPMSLSAPRETGTPPAFSKGRPAGASACQRAPDERRDRSAILRQRITRLLVMVDLQERNHDKMARDRASDLARSMENCTLAIRHARRLGLPIAFTRQADRPGSIERPAQSAWISGFEPKRSDMVFERQQPSCYTNQPFEDTVSRVGGFAISALVSEATCLATAIDASHTSNRVACL